MIFDAGTGAVREVVMVLTLAVLGLLLAMVAAFTPWYGGGSTERGAVVELLVPETTTADATTQVIAREGPTPRAD